MINYAPKYLENLIYLLSNFLPVPTPLIPFIREVRLVADLVREGREKLLGGGEGGCKLEELGVGRRRAEVFPPDAAGAGGGVGHVDGRRGATLVTNLIQMKNNLN